MKSVVNLAAQKPLYTFESTFGSTTIKTTLWRTRQTDAMTSMQQADYINAAKAVRQRMAEQLEPVVKKERREREVREPFNFRDEFANGIAPLSRTPKRSWGAETEPSEWS